MDVNNVSVSLSHFSSPHLEFFNSSLRNVTFVNVTIDSLLLSNVTVINFIIINSDYQNQFYCESMFPSAWWRFFHIADIHTSFVYNESVDESPIYCQW